MACARESLLKNVTRPPAAMRTSVGDTPDEVIVIVASVEGEDGVPPPQPTTAASAAPTANNTKRFTVENCATMSIGHTPCKDCTSAHIPGRAGVSPGQDVMGSLGQRYSATSRDSSSDRAVRISPISAAAQPTPTQTRCLMTRRSVYPVTIGAAGLLILTFFCTQLPAQTLYGTLVGNITDPSGLPVADASVRAVNSGTGLERETKTNERGGFQFSDLPPGTYEFTVRGESFAPFTTTGLQISANAVTRADAQLQLKTLEESVSVA